MVLGSKRFPLEVEQAHIAFRKLEFSEVSEGLGLILNQLCYKPGTFFYDPDESQPAKEEREVDEEVEEV